MPDSRLVQLFELLEDELDSAIARRDLDAIEQISVISAHFDLDLFDDEAPHVKVVVASTGDVREWLEDVLDLDTEQE